MRNGFLKNPVTDAEREINDSEQMSVPDTDVNSP